MNVTGALISQIDDDITDQSEGKDVEPASASSAGILPTREGAEDKLFQTEHTSHISPEISVDEDKKPDSVYHGKRALEVDILEIKEKLTDSDQYNSDATGDSMEREKYTETYDQERMESFLSEQQKCGGAKSEDESLDFDDVQPTYSKAHPVIQISIDEADSMIAGDEELDASAVKFEPHLQTIQSDMELVNVENDQSSFDLTVDSVDLDRPVTPTPVDRKQHFFHDDQTLSDNENPDEEMEIQASEFVESVLSEACARVYRDENHQIIDDQATNDENVQDESLTHDEISDEQESEIDSKEKYMEQTGFEDKNVQKDSPIQQRQTHSVLVKQISEDIPGITLTTHFHREHDSDEDFSHFYKDKVDISKNESNNTKEEQSDVVYYKYTTNEETNDYTDVQVPSKSHTPGPSYKSHR